MVVLTLDRVGVAVDDVGDGGVSWHDRVVVSGSWWTSSPLRRVASLSKNFLRGFYEEIIPGEFLSEKKTRNNAQLGMHCALKT